MRRRDEEQKKEWDGAATESGDGRSDLDSAASEAGLQAVGAVVAASEAGLQADGAVVTAVEADPKRRAMYRITVAVAGGAEPELLSVHEDTLIEWRLLKGRTLTTEEWAALRKTEEVEQAYRASLNMLDRKARTKKELETALKRKGHSPEAIAACLDRLTSHRLVDDTAYAKRYAEQKVANQRKGSRLVRQELLQRGVKKNDVEQAISSLDAKAERRSALELARKRWPSTKGDTRREREYRLMAVLQRRGYPAGVALEAVKKAADEAGDSRGSEGSDWDGIDEAMDTGMYGAYEE
ncbi:hypothetical protein J19TS2_11630 [Cohnella xylanilytica]|uniref:Regulatory protein RecX n=1 Tax=Cohnella xylanilytica TaxID=557555 RepID=A0A841TVN7_9BACL|nr:RecX family transcriptional regulator [Cohnella xylanilytica]MBB6690243.1 RecX family transcriptional regulator [Cohnella xylanilytica]GIO11608.1 hypothetical protein J19TS2_11630 [Cohnella xylanilytica]